MSSTTLLASALLSMVATIAYLLVARAIQDRQVQGAARTALNAFALWWYALASLAAYAVVTTPLAAFGLLRLDVVLTALNGLLIVLCAGLWGLTYYLFFLYTGRTHLRWPLGAFYAAYYLALQYLVVAGHPTGLRTRDWTVEITYANPVSGTAPALALAVLLLLPPLVGAIGYFSLILGTREAILRYRIGLVAGGIMAWFGLSLIAALTGLNQKSAWPLVSRLVSLMVPLLILAAYRPPRWVQHRLVRGLGKSSAA